MKLFFDARYIRTDHHDGISRYSMSLLQALARLQPVTAIICDKKQVDFIPHDIEFVMVNKPSSWRELFIAQTLDHYKPDVVFSPMQLTGGFFRKYHLLLTVHDLIYYEYKTPPTNLAPPIRLIWWLYHQAYWPQRWLLNRADVIIAVSNTTKQLLRQHWLTRRPIRVVYNAPFEVAKKTSPKPEHNRKDLIYMGSFMPYKNVEMLIHSLFFLPEYQLHCLSPISETRKQELLAQAPPKQLVFHNGVSDDEYEQLLGSAHALVTASKNEGFGLPVIEAMRLGVPVICSDLPIFHEVAGKYALFFEADNQTEFAKQVIRLEDSKLRTALVKHGQEYAKKFNWKTSAKELLRAIKDFTE